LGSIYTCSNDGTSSFSQGRERAVIRSGSL